MPSVQKYQSSISTKKHSQNSKISRHLNQKESNTTAGIENLNTEGSSSSKKDILSSLGLSFVNSIKGKKNLKYLEKVNSPKRSTQTKLKRTISQSDKNDNSQDEEYQKFVHYRERLIATLEKLQDTAE